MVWWIGGLLIASNPDTQAFADFAPGPTFSALWYLVETGTIWETIYSSLYRIVYGLFWGIVIGVPTGILVGYFLMVRQIANMPFQFLRMISPLAWMPIAVLAFETYIRGMMKNKHLAKAIANQKLAFFKQCLQYKCELNGIAFVEADQWFPSSKLCNNCGTLKKDLKRSDRVYHCACGHHCDRDLNASYNLRDYQVV